MSKASDGSSNKLAFASFGDGEAARNAIAEALSEELASAVASHKQDCADAVGSRARELAAALVRERNVGGMHV